MFFKSQAEWFRYSHHMAPLPTSIPVAMSVERSTLPTQSTIVFPTEPTGGLNQFRAFDARPSLSPVVSNTRRAGHKQSDISPSAGVCVLSELAVTPASSMQPPQDAYMHPGAQHSIGPASCQVPDLSHDRQNQASRAPLSSLLPSEYLDYMPSPNVPPHAYFANTFAPSRAHNGPTVQSLPISGPFGPELVLASHHDLPDAGHQQSQIPLSGPFDPPGAPLANVLNPRQVPQYLNDRYAAGIAAPIPLRIPIQNQGFLLSAACTSSSLPGSSPGPPYPDLIYPEDTDHNDSERTDEDHTLFNTGDPDVVDTRKTSSDLAASHCRPLTPDTMFALMDPVLMSWCA